MNAVASIADLSGAIHALAGRSAALDDVTRFAAQDLLYAVVLVFGILWCRRDGLRAGLAAGLGALVAVAISAIIGDVHHSARPFIAGHYAPLFAHADDAAFPSDHLAALGAVTAGAWMSSRRIGAATAVLALMIAFARVYAGVHYVGDVTAGFVIGVAAGLLVWSAIRPLVPMLDRLDAGLRRCRLRPGTHGKRPSLSAVEFAHMDPG